MCHYLIFRPVSGHARLAMLAFDLQLAERGLIAGLVTAVCHSAMRRRCSTGIEKIADVVSGKFIANVAVVVGQS